MNPLPPLTTDRWLRPYQQATTVRAALTHLAEHRERTQLLQLYHALFPAQWTASTSALTPTPGRVWSPREWEFLELLQTDCFPLDLPWLATVSERPSAVPIHDLMNDWRAAPLEDDRPGWQFLWVLSGAAPFAARLLPDPTLHKPLAAAAHGPPIEYEVVAAACRQIGGPLVALPAALDLIYGETDNSWLDGGLECDAGWDAADIHSLTDEYTAAQALLATVTLFLAWLEQPGHMLEVLTLWQTWQATRP
ncbi:MAG: hypothetical protein M3Z04_05780 [Chloroflexota bacterium]|nr:hypothetical protein [Chloroflexota bacterium]